MNNNQINTLKHGLVKISKKELLDILASRGKRGNYKKTKKEELMREVLAIYTSSNDNQKKILGQEIANKAFDKCTRNFDEFIYAYDHQAFNIELDSLKEKLEEFNNNEEQQSITIKGKIENVKEIEQGIISLTVVRYRINYVYDYDDKYSKPYNDRNSAEIKIYTSKGLIFVNSSNSNIQSTLKNVLAKALQCVYGDGFIIKKPILSQAILDIVYDKESNKAQLFNNVNKKTIKLLDIIYEFENDSYGFDSFKVTNIKFDHEERYIEDLVTKIEATEKVGSNLLHHKETIKDIIDGRELQYVKLIITYKNDGLSTCISAGLEFEKGYLRIFIKNTINEIVSIDTLDSAFNSLIELIINSYENSTIKNNSKILSLLGVDIDGNNEEPRIYTV